MLILDESIQADRSAPHISTDKINKDQPRISQPHMRITTDLVSHARAAIASRLLSSRAQLA